MKKLVFEVDDLLKGELENLAKRDQRSLASYVRLVLQGHVDEIERTSRQRVAQTSVVAPTTEEA